MLRTMLARLRAAWRGLAGKAPEQVVRLSEAEEDALYRRFSRRLVDDARRDAVARHGYRGTGGLWDLFREMGLPNG